MGMRPDIHAGAQQKFGRPHLVKENEWPDHLSLRGWQRPPHGKAAEIPRAGDDDYVNRVTGECFTRLRIDGRLPALGEIASDVRNPSRLAVGLPRYLGETGFDRCQELLRLEGLMQATRPIKGVKSVPGAFGQNRVDAWQG